MKILILTTDQELALLRQRALETAGHEVVVTITEKEALEAPDKLGRVDVALVCHRLPDATARKVIRLFHERHPEGKVCTSSIFMASGPRWKQTDTWWGPTDRTRCCA